MKLNLGMLKIARLEAAQWGGKTRDICIEQVDQEIIDYCIENNGPGNMENVKPGDWVLSAFDYLYSQESTQYCLLGDLDIENNDDDRIFQEEVIFLDFLVKKLNAYRRGRDE